LGNLIAAIQLPFLLQRDEYNLGVAAGCHAEVNRANYLYATLPVTNNNAYILIE
jgi:hypothetical protein